MFISRSFPGGKRWSFRFSFFEKQAKGQLVNRDKAARHGVASYRISITSLFRVLSVNWRDYRQKTSRRAFAVANSIFHVRLCPCATKRGYSVEVRGRKKVIRRRAREWKYNVNQTERCSTWAWACNCGHEFSVESLISAPWLIRLHVRLLPTAIFFKWTNLKSNHGLHRAFGRRASKPSSEESKKL